MPTAINPGAVARKEAAERGKEWKHFRKTFLYSQNHLAHALGCSRRTVAAIESGREVFHPSYSVLRKFRDLKRKQEQAYPQLATPAFALPVPSGAERRA